MKKNILIRLVLAIAVVHSAGAVGNGGWWNWLTTGWFGSPVTEQTQQVQVQMLEDATRVQLGLPVLGINEQRRLENYINSLIIDGVFSSQVQGYQFLSADYVEYGNVSVYKMMSNLLKSKIAKNKTIAKRRAQIWLALAQPDQIGFTRVGSGLPPTIFVRRQAYKKLHEKYGDMRTCIDIELSACFAMINAYLPKVFKAEAIQALQQEDVRLWTEQFFDAYTNIQSNTAADIMRGQWSGADLSMLTQALTMGLLPQYTTSGASEFDQYVLGTVQERAGREPTFSQIFNLVTALPGRLSDGTRVLTAWQGNDVETQRFRAMVEGRGLSETDMDVLARDNPEVVIGFLAVGSGMVNRTATVVQGIIKYHFVLNQEIQRPLRWPTPVQVATIMRDGIGLEDVIIESFAMSHLVDVIKKVELPAGVTVPAGLDNFVVQYGDRPLTDAQAGVAFDRLIAGVAPVELRV